MSAASERERTWEQRIWTGLQACLLAVLGWVGASIGDMSKTVSELSKTVVRIEERLSSATAAQNAMAAAQITRDRVQDERIEAISREVNTLLQRIEPRSRTHREQQ